jgi:hypothetical protein
VGQLSIAGFAEHSVRPSCERSRVSSTWGHHSVRPQRGESEQVADVAREAQTLAQEIPLWVSVVRKADAWRG